MIPPHKAELASVLKLLKSPYEVNQELGIATLKAVGIPQENWQEWHRLISASIQKLRFCLQYGFQEELKIVGLSDLAYADRAYLNIVEFFPNIERLYLSKQSYLGYDWMISWEKIPKLQSLSLAYNQLKQFPPSLSKANQLERLILTGNRLLKLDAAIGQFQALKFLSLRKNRLRKLPTQLSTLEHLEHLDLSINYLQNLEDSLFRWPKIEQLNLAHNQLKILPETIGRLENLRSLNISGNKIEHLPESLLHLPRLELLNLKATPLASDQSFLASLKARFPTLSIHC